MYLLMWLLLLGRALALLMPYMVGVAGGLLVMFVLPVEVPTIHKLLIGASVAAGVIAGIRGEAPRK
jgi:hypothetical protein